MSTPSSRRHRREGHGRVVLVTDGEQRAALAVVRSLGRAGYRVLVCAARSHSLAGGSRFCRTEVQVPDPLSAPDAFLDQVCAIVTRSAVDTVVPITEAALLAILPARDRLGSVRVPFPDAAAFRRISDKAAVLTAAPACGIAVPKQWTLGNREQIIDLDDANLPFPLVLKPARSIGERGGRRGKFGVGYARDASDLRRQLAAYDDGAFPILLQQRISGPGIGIFVLLWDGALRAAFSHRRLREKPPSGGVSVYRESHPLDPDLLARSCALLERFGWQGVAMVEYKLDAATGTPFLMEINGRFWGSLQLAIDAGVDFPTLLLRAADGHVASPPPYRLGVRSRWWWGDVDHLLLRLRSDGTVLHPDASGRARAVLEFCRLWWPGDRNETLHFGDPVPFLRETVQWLQHR